MDYSESQELYFKQRSCLFLSYMLQQCQEFSSAKVTSCLQMAPVLSALSVIGLYSCHLPSGTICVIIDTIICCVCNQPVQKSLERRNRQSPSQSARSLHVSSSRTMSATDDIPRKNQPATESYSEPVHTHTAYF